MFDDVCVGGFVGLIGRWDEVGKDVVVVEIDECYVDVVVVFEDVDVDVVECCIWLMV